MQKLSESDGMALVTIRVSRGTATLSGSATSATLKSQAEQVVRAVRGVTAVDNQITVSRL
jgi:osmotically-inducible protein OsmY